MEDPVYSDKISMIEEILTLVALAVANLLCQCFDNNPDHHHLLWVIVGVGPQVDPRVGPHANPHS